MGWFFSRTKDSTKKAEAREPVPYELICACGNVVAGMREKSAQKVSCSACSKLVFVLPISPYPSIVGELVKTKKKDSKSNDEDGDAANSQGGDVAAIPPRMVVVEELGAVEVTTGDRVRSWFSPVWLASAGIVIALAVTAGVVVHRQRIDQARLVLQRDGEAGLQAIKDNRLAEARDLLRKAVEALNILAKKDDDFSAMIRQSYQEAWAGSELLPGTILDYLGGKELPASRWLIFDLPVVKAASGLVELDFPFSAGAEGGKPIHLFLSATSWIDDLGGKLNPEQPVRVIFAAQVKSIENTEKRIIVSLEDTSSFLWLNYGTLSSLGLAGSEKEQASVQETLQAQQQLVKSPKEKP